MTHEIAQTTTPQPPLTPIGTSSLLRVKRLHPDAQLPWRAHPSDAAFDIFAYARTKEGRPSTIMVPARDTRRISTGLAVCPPEGYFVSICSRSDLSGTKSVFVANAPTIVDPGYRGDLSVNLFNGGASPYWVQHGDRIAQIILLPLLLTSFVEDAGLPDGDRGESGFGSTDR